MQVRWLANIVEPALAGKAAFLVAEMQRMKWPLPG
jgi:hypothetical protein